MAPLPNNSTGVLYVDYTTEGEEHTLQLRFGDPGSFNDAMDVAVALFAAMDSFLYSISSIACRVRDAGGNVTYPVSWTGDEAYGSSTEGHYATAQYADFVGRSIDGRRCRVAFFGVKGIVDTTGKDFRFPSSTTWVGDVLAALRAGDTSPVSISGLVVNWYDYADTGINAYWRNRIRA